MDKIKQIRESDSKQKAQLVGRLKDAIRQKQQDDRIKNVRN